MSGAVCGWDWIGLVLFVFCAPERVPIKAQGIRVAQLVRVVYMMFG